MAALVLVVCVNMLDEKFSCIKLYQKSGFTFYWRRRWVYEKCRSYIFRSKIDLRVVYYGSKSCQFFTNWWKALSECITPQTGIITNSYKSPSANI